MTIDELVLLLKASQANGLTTLQELILRSSWEGKTYTNIADEAHSGEERVKKIAAHLWQVLSNFCKEPILYISNNISKKASISTILMLNC